MSICTRHHYGSDGRCTRCQMKAVYYNDAIGQLESWSDIDKRNPAERWQEKMDSFRCKPHTHPEEVTSIE